MRPGNVDLRLNELPLPGSVPSAASMQSQLERIDAAVERVNLIAAIDAPGRSGNVFFLTLFDRHPEVSCCPLVQYTYSYLISKFGDSKVIEAQAAYAFVSQLSYFRLLYNEPAGANGTLVTRMGGDIAMPIDRVALRDLLDAYFAGRATFSRREVVLAPFIAYALSRGGDLDRIKYVLVGDAISLRQEHVMQGFSGRIIDTILEDFPKARLVRLLRDPRATFASPRHQYVNAFGNMYDISPGKYWSRLRSLMGADLSSDYGCVYLYWLLYLRQTRAAIIHQINRHTANFITVRNEDLNTNFVPTTRRLAAWLGIEWVSDWQTESFVPTIGGAEWSGIGAYNSRYQTAVAGQLENDPDEVAKKVTGPNLYVTQRWRSRLSKREIELIEHLFRDELQEFGYEILYDVKDRSDAACLLRTALLPFEGEMPNMNWLKKGRALGWREFGRRLFYSMSFPPFYVLSRLLLAHLVLRKKLFLQDASPATAARGELA
jgi:Sulfotransferase family